MYTQMGGLLVPVVRIRHGEQWRLKVGRLIQLSHGKFGKARPSLIAALLLVNKMEVGLRSTDWDDECH